MKHFADICFNCLIRRQSTSASFSKDLWGMSICESQRHVNLPVFLDSTKSAWFIVCRPVAPFRYFVCFFCRFSNLCNFSFYTKKGSKLKLSFVFFFQIPSRVLRFQTFSKKGHQDIKTSHPDHQPTNPPPTSPKGCLMGFTTFGF